MSAAAPAVVGVRPCTTPIRHAPISMIYEEHHVQPESWGGAKGPRVLLCPTCHHSVHILIDLYVETGGKPTRAQMRRRFGRYPVDYWIVLADEAWALRPDPPTLTS